MRHQVYTFKYRQKSTFHQSARQHAVCQTTVIVMLHIFFSFCIPPVTKDGKDDNDNRLLCAKYPCNTEITLASRFVLWIYASRMGCDKQPWVVEVVDLLPHTNPDLFKICVKFPQEHHYLNTTTLCHSRRF